MAGLFDFSENAAPLLQGLLSGVGAGLASRGNRTQALGAGLFGAVNGYSGGQQNALMADYRNSQLSSQKLAQDKLQRQNDYLQNAGQPPTAQSSSGVATAFPVGTSGVPSMPAAPQQAGYTWAGLLQAGFDPDTAKKILSQGGPTVKDFDLKDVTPESYRRYLQTNNPADLQSNQFMDPNQPFLRDANGNLVPNTPFQRFALQKASAGAARTNVRVENKTGESLAGQIGPMMKDSLADAESAVATMDAANRISTTLNSGNFFSGKLGNTGMTLTQWKDALNMTGPDEKAALANTRSMMQGLAKLTLQGRQQMRGQGAVSNNEGDLAERVSSGDFSLTPAELATLAGSAQRSAAFIYGNYQKRFNALKGNENYAPMAPYYEAPALPAMVAPQVQQPVPPTANPNVDTLLNKYR